jgi:hypothetical protein
MLTNFLGQGLRIRGAVFDVSSMWSRHRRRMAAPAYHSTCCRTSSRALREPQQGTEKGNGGKCSMSVCLYVCREERENPSTSVSFFCFSVLHLRSLISEARDLFVVLNYRSGIDLRRSARPMFGFAEREILLRLLQKTPNKMPNQQLSMKSSSY